VYDFMICMYRDIVITTYAKLFRFVITRNFLNTYELTRNYDVITNFRNYVTTLDPLQFFGETGNENDVTVSIFWEDK
jgi:hypothetical protein